MDHSGIVDAVLARIDKNLGVEQLKRVCGEEWDKRSLYSQLKGARRLEVKKQVWGLVKDAYDSYILESAVDDVKTVFAGAVEVDAEGVEIPPRYLPVAEVRAKIAELKASLKKIPDRPMF